MQLAEWGKTVLWPIYILPGWFKQTSPIIRRSSKYAAILCDWRVYFWLETVLFWNDLIWQTNSQGNEVFQAISSYWPNSYYIDYELFVLEMLIKLVMKSILFLGFD